MTQSTGANMSFSHWRGPILLFMTIPGLLLVQILQPRCAPAQSPTRQSEPVGTAEERIQRLTAAVDQAEVQISQYQEQLRGLRQELTALKQELAVEKQGSPKYDPASPSVGPQASSANAETAASEPDSSFNDLRERQAMQQSQIATLEQTKVESASKFPVKLSGLVLFNAFVNTSKVDVPPDPTFALLGSGSTGFSVQQTVLGLDARGPHLFGATSHADVRVDFFASEAQYG